MNNFQYDEDYNFFLEKLAKGNVPVFKRKYSKMFDFRDPRIKRDEFNKIRSNVFKELVSKYGMKCQLGICKDCSKEKVFDVDHYIPLSTNVLNKELRKIKPQEGKKVITQSFGSNDISNLRIACKSCNSYKKHRIII